MNEEQMEMAGELVAFVVRNAIADNREIDVEDLKKMAENAVEAFSAGVKKINAAG